MIVGVPKEVKVREYRVGMTPAGVKKLVDRGHKVLVEKSAGVGSGLPDDLYIKAGAEMVDDIKAIYARSEMVVKVKEPIELEYPLLRENQILYTYLHLAADKKQAEALVKSKCVAIAYETIEVDGALPLLKPMSEVAGRMAVQVGANTLEKEHGGKGLLLGGVPGVKRGRITILGGGVVGRNAAKMAVGCGAQVRILDVNLRTLDYLDDIFGQKVQTLYSDADTIAKSVRDCDLLIGAVLIPGAAAPKLVSEKLVSEMEEGSVIVDVAVDQGGCIETNHPTTHDHPTYVVHGVVHYSVANMPGAVPHTSTFALTNTTIGYAAMLADMGADAAIKKDASLAMGVNVYKGEVVYKAVADSISMKYTPLEKMVK
jgi:alanine dehydrogenase